MNESQIAEAMRSALDDDTAGLTARPDAAQRARQEGRRRRVTRGVLAAVPAIAVVGAGAAFAVHGSGTSTPTASSGATQHAVTVGYVTKRAEAALGQYTDYIAVTTQQMPGSSVTTWFDPSTGNQRQILKAAGDTIVQWHQPYTVGNYRYWKVTVTDTGKQTWWSDTVHSSQPMQQGAPSGAVAPSPFSSPAQVKQALNSGAVTIAGHGVVDGQAAIDLRLNPKQGQADFWVNSETYQPVKITVDSGHAIDISWLQRSSSVVTQTNNPQIPAGYKQVSAPAQH